MSNIHNIILFIFIMLSKFKKFISGKNAHIELEEKNDIDYKWLEEIKDTTLVKAKNNFIEPDALKKNYIDCFINVSSLPLNIYNEYCNNIYNFYRKSTEEIQLTIKCFAKDKNNKKKIICIIGDNLSDELFIISVLCMNLYKYKMDKISTIVNLSELTNDLIMVLLKIEKEIFKKNSMSDFDIAYIKISQIIGNNHSKNEVLHFYNRSKGDINKVIERFIS